MDTFFRFVYEFLLQFFQPIIDVFKAIFNGILKMFNVGDYIKILNFYKDDFSGAEWVFVCLAILLIVLILGGIIFLVYFLIRKYLRFRKTLVEQESLLEEVADLNKEVNNLMKEKQDILAMKVSQLGLKPGEEATEEVGEEEEKVDVADSRFAKLTAIDEEYKNYKIKNYNNSFS